MKKTLSMLLALVMMFVCAFSAISLAETAEETQTAAEATEMGDVLIWLSSQITEEEAQEILTWDKEKILEKLQGYDQPLETITLEDVADELMQVISLFNLFASVSENKDGETTEESGEGISGLLNLLGGLTGGENSEDSEATEAGAEGLGALLSLFGGLTGGGSSEDGEATEANGEGLGGLLSLFSNLTAGETSEEDGEEESAPYEIVENFDGTFWKSGEKQLEVVWQDGFYKVAITEGDTELSYLCTLDESGENLVLTSEGTGSEDLDEEQADHGVATFTLNDEGNLVWTNADGEETVFTTIIDPLSINSWYADGKTLHLEWRGNQDYSVFIDGGVEEGYMWTYDCTLDEETNTLNGTGKKEQYGEEQYTDANVTFTFSDDRILLTWHDDQEPETDDGVTFEMVERAFTLGWWSGEGVDEMIGYFDNGNYMMTVTMGETNYKYACTYDRGNGVLTAADPATLNAEELADAEDYKSTATFTLQDENHLIWLDSNGASGEEGIVLERAEEINE